MHYYRLNVSTDVNADGDEDVDGDVAVDGVCVDDIETDADAGDRKRLSLLYDVWDRGAGLLSIVYAMDY